MVGITQTATPVEQAPSRCPDTLHRPKSRPSWSTSAVDGCQRATLDPNLYYCAKDEHWFRWAMNRWYMAFAWDGNWFPTTKTELPKGLAAITPAPEEVKKSREDRLKELEQELEKLDPEKAPQSGN